MTKKSKKRRMSKRVQKLSLPETSNGTAKVSIYKEKNHEAGTKNKDKQTRSSSFPFDFEEPDWFRDVVSELCDHMGIIPRVVY